MHRRGEQTMARTFYQNAPWFVCQVILHGSTRQWYIATIPTNDEVTCNTSTMARQLNWTLRQNRKLSRRAHELLEDTSVDTIEFGVFVFSEGNPFGIRIARPGTAFITSKLVETDYFAWIHWMMRTKQAQEV